MVASVLPLSRSTKRSNRNRCCAAWQISFTLSVNEKCEFTNLIHKSHGLRLAFFLRMHFSDHVPLSIHRNRKLTSILVAPRAILTRWHYVLSSRASAGTSIFNGERVRIRRRRKTRLMWSTWQIGIQTTVVLRKCDQESVNLRAVFRVISYTTVLFE